MLIVGNCPSSGSSYLADLLDSVPSVISGEELTLFSTRTLYDFARFKRNPFVSANTFELYYWRTHLTDTNLYAYGHDQHTIGKLVGQSETLPDFLEKFRQRYTALRGKPEHAIWVEKTPENIACLDAILNQLHQAHFVFMVRDPMHVMMSLVRRGFSRRMALTTWLLAAGKYARHAAHLRNSLLRYEDLVSAPYQIVSELLRRTQGAPVSATEVEEGYASSRYRRQFGVRLASWSVKTVGAIADANQRQPDTSDRAAFARFLKLRIDMSYASRFELEPLSALDALKLFGYLHLAEQYQAETESKPSWVYTPRERGLILGKWLMSLTRGDGELGDLVRYAAPLSPV